MSEFWRITTDVQPGSRMAHVRVERVGGETLFDVTAPIDTALRAFGHFVQAEANKHERAAKGVR